MYKSYEFQFCSHHQHIYVYISNYLISIYLILLFFVFYSILYENFISFQTFYFIYLSAQIFISSNYDGINLVQKKEK